MPPAVAAAAITAGGAIGGSLLANKGKKKVTETTTTTPDYTDYFGGQYGHDPKVAELQQSLLDQLNNQIAAFNDPTDLPSVGSISIPHVGGAQHMHATHAVASLINMLDQAFQAEPNAGLREDVYSRAKSGANAGADDSIRRLMDSARASGAGPNAPWVQQLSMEAREKAGQSSTQALTDFFDSYVTAALGRRAAALGQNSDTQTKVNMFNAGADNSASEFNASADNAVNALNAQLGLNGQTARSSLALQLAGLKDTRRNNIMDMLLHLTQQIPNGSSTTRVTSGGGGNSWLPAVTSAASNIIRSFVHPSTSSSTGAPYYGPPSAEAVNGPPAPWSPFIDFTGTGIIPYQPLPGSGVPDIGPPNPFQFQ